jgi:hypothetical protein
MPAPFTYLDLLLVIAFFFLGVVTALFRGPGLWSAVQGAHIPILMDLLGRSAFAAGSRFAPVDPPSVTLRPWPPPIP